MKRSLNILGSLSCAFTLSACAIEDSFAVENDVADAPAATPCEVANVDDISRYLAEVTQAHVPQSTVMQEITQRWCSLEQISTVSPGPRPMTSVSDVDWTNMSMFWDNQAKVYLATAQWHWTRQGYLDADIVVCFNNNIGGTDGVGIRFSGGGMRIIGKAATAWGNPAKDSYNRDFGAMSVPYSRVSDSGVGFVAQDTATKLQSTTGACTDGQYDYNMWGGNVVITFKNLNGCRNVQMYPGYIHTWDNTSITSLGAAKRQFSIGWSSAGDSWIREEAGPTANICS